jgi:O-acetyl-ADP-ribose deacetylase (regulator of RNase III)
VGPIYGRDERDREAELLAACYRNSLTLARHHDLSSLAFPAISTGIYGYPKTEAAVVSSRTIKQFLSSDDSIQQVRLVFFHDADARLFREYQEFE